MQGGLLLSELYGMSLLQVSLNLTFYVMEGWIEQACDSALCFVKILVAADC